MQKKGREKTEWKKREKTDCLFFVKIFVDGNRHIGNFFFSMSGQKRGCKNSLARSLASLARWFPKGITGLTEEVLEICMFFQMAGDRMFHTRARGERERATKPSVFFFLCVFFFVCCFCVFLCVFLCFFVFFCPKKHETLVFERKTWYPKKKFSILEKFWYLRNFQCPKKHDTLIRNFEPWGRKPPKFSGACGPRTPASKGKIPPVAGFFWERQDFFRVTDLLKPHVHTHYWRGREGGPYWHYWTAFSNVSKVLLPTPRWGARPDYGGGQWEWDKMMSTPATNPTAGNSLFSLSRISSRRET